MSEPRALHKTLGLPFAIAVCVGSMVGTGIMRAPGAIADMVPDPAIVMMLWLAGGAYVLLMCNVAAEISGMIPRSGGHYIPVREGLGDAMGLLVGWTMWIGFVAANAAIAIAAAEFLGTVVPWVEANVAVSALFITLCVTALNWAGVEEGRKAQIIGTAVKIAMLLAVVVVAFAIPTGEAAREVAAAPAAPPEPLTLLAILGGLQFVIAVYDGWYSAIYFAGEDKDPGRNIPRSLFQAALVVIFVYVAVNWALIRALDFTALRVSTLPMAAVIEAVSGNWGSIIVGLLAFFMAISTLNGLVMATPRILYGLAEDGLFLKSALRVNAGGTPTFALAAGTIIAVPLIFSGSYVFVFRLMGALTLFGTCLYVLSYFTLRRRRPDMPRHYRARGHPVLPAFILAVNVALVASYVLSDWISGLVMVGLIAVCLPVGIYLGRQNARTLPVPSPTTQS